MKILDVGCNVLQLALNYFDPNRVRVSRCDTYEDRSNDPNYYQIIPGAPLPFTDVHLVINGASQLVRDVFGEAGRHARTALGVAQLPLGSSVEVEMILKIKPD